MICAENAENIAITGHGIINGNGHLWRPVKEFKMTARQWKELLGKSPYVIESKEGGIWFPARNMFDTAITGEIYPGDYDTFEEALAAASPHYDFYRPVMVSLRHCRNVLIEDVTLQDSPAWNVFCEHLTVRGVRIINPAYAQNGDGIDVESCRYVHIHHSEFQTGDDGICLKAGKDREARKLLKPCEDVYIHDCKVGMSHGGFVIGSEMSRGVHNVLVKDCTFIDSDVGIRFKSAMGRGGVVEDIYLEDILMIGIKKESLTMTMNYVLNTVSGDHPVVQSTDPEDIPTFRNIELRNCICRDEDAYYVIQPMSGYPDTIQDIRIMIAIRPAFYCAYIPCGSHWSSLHWSFRALVLPFAAVKVLSFSLFRHRSLFFLFSRPFRTVLIDLFLLAKGLSSLFSVQKHQFH